MKKQVKYQVVSSTFLGTVTHSNETQSYKYEITLNRSLQHTGKFSGIEYGLNRYEKREPWIEMGSSLISAFRYMVIGIQRLFWF